MAQTISLSFRDRLALMGRAVRGSLALDPQSVGGRLLSGVISPGGTPPVRGTRDFLASYSKMPWLRAVASRVSYDIAATDWKLFVERRGGKPVRSRVLQRANGVRRKMLLKAQVEGGEVEEITHHAALDLIDNANMMQTGLQMRRVTQLHMDLVGEAFWLIERGKLNQPVAVWPIPPSWVLGTPHPLRPFFRVSFKAWQGDIPESEIIWFADVDPVNPYGRGTGTTQALSDELEADEYACHDTETECLTRRGWVPGLSVTTDDEVATWDEHAGTLVYQKPTEVMRYRVDGAMHHWHGRSVDAMVTPNHRMWIRSKIYWRQARPEPAWHFETSAVAAKKPGRVFKMRDAAPYRASRAAADVTIPGVDRVTKRARGSRGGGRSPRRGVKDPLVFKAQDFGRFLGYFVSEGHTTRAGLSIGQNANRFADDIRNALSIFPAEWITEKSYVDHQSVGATAVVPIGAFQVWTVLHLGLAEWLRTHVGEDAYNKRLPVEVFEWEREAQLELLTGLMRGDGSSRNSRLGESGMYVTRSVGLADDVQRLCVLLGFSSTVSSCENGKAVMYQVNIKQHTGQRSIGGTSATKRTWVESVEYHGDVWCVSVPNGTMVTRRNGRVLVSGNSKHVKAFFYNSARPDLVVFPKNGGTMTEPDVERLEEEWTAKNQGFWRAFKPFFLKKEVEIKEIETGNFRTQQLVPLREFERNSILQVFGVSPETLGILGPGSNRACHSDDTECLTADGWKGIEALAMHDEIATWSHERQRLEYQRPSKIVKYRHDGPMHHWKTKNVDVLVTPDHRMYTQTQFSAGFEIKRSYEVFGKKLQQKWLVTGGGFSGETTRVVIPRGEYERHSGALDIDVPAETFALFLGHWIAEGSVASTPGDWRIRVPQNVGPMAQKMKLAMEALRGGPVGEASSSKNRKLPLVELGLSHRGLHQWLSSRCGASAGTKRIPAEAFSWPEDAQRLLLQGLMDGDGSKPLARTKSRDEYADRYFGTVSKQLADDVQRLCVHLGLRSSIRMRPGIAPRQDFYRVQVSSKRYAYVSSSKIGTAKRASVMPCKSVHYSGVAWCVEVPNHLFVTRRNGAVVVHGNTVTMGEQVYARRVLVPRLELIRSVLQERLMPMFDERLIVDYDSPVTKDHELEQQAAQAAPWSLTVDEWRERAGLEALPDEAGQVHMMPAALTPMAFKKGGPEDLMPEPEMDQTLDTGRAMDLEEPVPGQPKQPKPGAARDGAQ